MADVRTVSLPVAALHGPVVVAVVVHIALAVIQEAVLTLLQRHGAVRALEVVITEVRVRVRLHAYWLRARGNVQQHSCAN